MELLELVELVELYLSSMKIDWGKILSSQEEFNKHLKKIRNEKAKNNQAVV